VLRNEEIRNPLIACARSSPDGVTLAVSYFWGVSLWDAARGKMLRAIPAPPGKGRVVSLDFSPDGRRLAWQAIDDDELHLWDVDAGKEIRRFPQGRAGWYALAYAPDGEGIASVTNRLCFWDPETGKELYRKPLSGHCLAFSPDGTLLAIYSDAIRILEAATGEELARFPARVRHGGTWGLTFSPDGRYLAITELEKVGIWDVLAGKFVHTFGNHRGWTTSLEFTADGRRLVSASEDSTALVWDMSAVKAGHPPGPDLPAAWEDLGKPDRLRAYAALLRLRREPGPAVALLRERLRPIPAVDRARLDKLLKDLDAGGFAVRDRATDELKRLADHVPERLTKLAGRPTSLETRRRLDLILPKVGYSLQTRRLLWSLRLLEMTGTAEARALLRRMAEGEPEAVVTRRARAALERLARADAIAR
jgi:hypothetical protein